jgi:hypothetical protein
MELDNIDKLVEKYFEATTTVAEEKAIKAYFANEEVAPHLEKYTPMFAHFANTRKEEYTKPLSIKAKRNKPMWLSIAAAVVLLFGVYFLQPKNESLENEYTQEEIAAAQEAFELLALNFNKGSKQITYLGEFEKNTNKFLK